MRAGQSAPSVDRRAAVGAGSGHARGLRVNVFPRPATPTVTAPRRDVPGACPECGAERLQAYRVMSEGGWWIVVKCTACLHSLERLPGPLFGAFEPLKGPR